MYYHNSNWILSIISPGYRSSFFVYERRSLWAVAGVSMRALGRGGFLCLYYDSDQRPKAEGLSKIRVAKNFGYRVEVCLFRRRVRHVMHELKKRSIHTINIYEI